MLGSAVSLEWDVSVFALVLLLWDPEEREEAWILFHVQVLLSRMEVNLPGSKEEKEGAKFFLGLSETAWLG